MSGAAARTKFLSGLLLQLTIGFLILKIPAVTSFFQLLGRGMGKIEQFARAGAAFVYSGVAATTPSGVADFANGGFVFALINLQSKIPVKFSRV